MTRSIIMTQRRRLTGRRKSRVRVGPWPWIFFIALCLLAAVFGAKVEQAFRIWETTHAPKVQTSPSNTATRN